MDLKKKFETAKNKIKENAPAIFAATGVVVLAAVVVLRPKNETSFSLANVNPFGMSSEEKAKAAEMNALLDQVWSNAMAVNDAYNASMENGGSSETVRDKNGNPIIYVTAHVDN